MDAGRELDALVAELVFGQVVCRTRADIPEGWRLDNGQTVPGYCDGTFVYTLPAYSTDMVAAWEVVARLCPRGRMELTIYEDLSARVEVYLSKLPFQQATATAGEDTVPLAICRAALAAVAKEVPA